MAPPSIVGAVVGALLADDVSERLLYAAIAAVLLWSGIDLVFRPIRARSRGRLRLWPAAASGLAIGVLGGAVGVILGTLRMPALVRGVRPGRPASCRDESRRRLPARRRRLRHARRRAGVDWPILAAGLAGAIPGAGSAPRQPARIDENLLRIALGLVLVLVGAVFAGQALG